MRNRGLLLTVSCIPLQQILCHDQSFYMPPYATKFCVLFSCSKHCSLSFSGETHKNNISYLMTKQIKQQTWTAINQHFIVIHITYYLPEILQNYRYLISISQKSSFFFNNVSSNVRKVLISIFQIQARAERGCLFFN